MKAARVTALMSAVALTAVLPTAAAAPKVEVKSPDGRVVLTFRLTDEGAPGYGVTYQGN